MPPNNFSAYLRFISQPFGGEATDGELLDRFRNAGDQLAFSELIHRHGPTVYGVCRRILAHEQDAEDAFQTVFLMLARRAGRVDRRRVINWLYTVACRAAVKAKARRVKRTLLEQRAEVMTPKDVSKESDWDEIRAVLDDAILTLPPRLRAVILMCDLGGKLHREAAAELGVPLGTVSYLLDRAHRRLRDALLARGVTLSVAGVISLCVTKATAGVPPALALSSARLGAMPARVAVSTEDLTQAVAREMLIGKLRKIGLALALVIALTASAAGFAIGRNSPPSARSGDEQASPHPAPVAEPSSLASVALAPAPRPVPAFQHRGAVVSLVVSSDGSRIASSAKDGTVRVWDAKTGTEAIRLFSPPEGTRFLAFNKKGTLLTAEGADGEIARFRIGSFPETLPMEMKFPEAVQSFAYSADDKYGVLTGAHSLRVLYMTRPALDWGPNHMQSCLFKRSEVHIAELTSRGHEPRTAFAFRPDKDAFVWVDTAGGVFECDLESGKTTSRNVLKLPEAAKGFPTAVALDGTGRYAVWGGRNGMVSIADLKTDRRLYRGSLRGWGTIRTLGFTRSAPAVIVADDEGRVAIIEQGEEDLEPQLLTDTVAPVQVVAFPLDGEAVLLGCEDGRIRRWSLKTHKEVLTPGKVK